MSKAWFEVWFDTPYYHILYKRHDETDARKAIDNLIGALHLPAAAKVLDLACGKGRHAVYLADLGFDVTGIDISDSSIEFARQFEHEHLSFYQHDMRKPFRIQYYDAVFNFFTSFGYFDRERDHQQAISHVASGLRPGGRFLIDFFNSRMVQRQLVPRESKIIDGICFELFRHTADGYIIKDVHFNQHGTPYHFREQVRLLEPDDFEGMMQRAGLRTTATYGAYDLRAFDPDSSERLIIVAEKQS